MAEVTGTQCSNGGEHDFDEPEEDSWLGDNRMVRPTRCSNCDQAWDYYVYEFDGEFDFEEKGDSECSHDWHDIDWSSSGGSDGSPEGREACSKCPAERKRSFHLAETYVGDQQGNRI